MNKQHLLPIKESRLGVIGGSGFYSIDKIECHEEIEVNTPYGNLQIQLGSLKLVI